MQCCSRLLTLRPRAGGGGAKTSPVGAQVNNINKQVTKAGTDTVNGVKHGAGEATHDASKAAS